MDISRKNIAFLLDRRGVTVNQAGVESGVDQPWLYKYMTEQIKKPNHEKIGLLERYFGVPPGSILYRDLTQPGALASQPTQLEQETMEAAVKLMAELEKFSPVVPDPATYAERLTIAAKVVAIYGASGILEGVGLPEPLLHYAAELRKRG